MKKIVLPLFIIIVLAVALIFTPMRSKLASATFFVVKPAQSVFSKAGGRIGRWFSFAGSISSLHRENAELSAKILSLEVDRSRIAELEYENSLLEQEIGFAQSHTEATLTPARIIGREPTTFLDNFIIDKGSDDGVSANMAVISGGALVGQVKEVYAKQSRVILITSKDSIILAMLQDSRAQGILRGGVSGLTLEDITADVTINSGDYVVTSGLDGEIESGILIGTTNEITSSKSELFKNVAVEPAVDLSKLEMVFLMK